MTMRTVTATYKDPTGNPLSGRVSFQLAVIASDGTATIYGAAPITVTLNGTGQLSLALVTTDSLTVANLAYQVTETLAGQKANRFYMTLAAGGSPIDLATVTRLTNVVLYDYATNSGVTSAIATHNADTTAVHGIADTSALALTADVVAKGSLVFNVKDYGAKGDGVTDDTTAIQAALNAAATAGGAAYVPVGNYKTTATLTLAGNVSIVGPGTATWSRTVPTVSQGACIVPYTSADSPAISIAPSSRGCSVQGISLNLVNQANGSVNNAYARTQSKGIHVDAGWNWLIRDVYITGTPSNGSAVYIDDGVSGLGSFWGHLDNVFIDQYTKVGIANGVNNPSAAMTIAASDQTARGIVMNGAVGAVTAVTMTNVTTFRGLYMNNVNQVNALNFHTEHAPAHGVHVNGGINITFIGGFFENAGSEDPAGNPASYRPIFGAGTPRRVRVIGSSLVGNGLDFTQFGAGFVCDTDHVIGTSAGDQYRRFGALLIDRAGQGRFTGSTNIRVRGGYSATTALTVGSDNVLYFDKSESRTWDSQGLYSTGSSNFSLNYDATDGFSGKVRVTYTLYFRKSAGTFAADDWIDVKIVFAGAKYPDGTSIATDATHRHYPPSGNTTFMVSGTFDVSFSSTYSSFFNMKAATNAANVIAGLADTDDGRGLLSYQVVA